MRGSARTSLRLLAIVAIVACAEPSFLLSAQPGAKAEPEYLLGIWRLDLTRSRYSPGPPPKSETRTFSRDEDGLKGVVERFLADGREERIGSPRGLRSGISGVGRRYLHSFQADRRADVAGGPVARRGHGVARRVVSEDGRR